MTPRRSIARLGIVQESQSPAAHPSTVVTSVKIIVAGAFGAGKTTFVGSVSEIKPLTTEAPVSPEAAEIDDRLMVPGKTTTTVAMDFGRTTLDEGLILYLFGTPGQQRFWFMWDDLIRGAIGAVVLVDTRRLVDSFPAVDYFEAARLPFIIGINGFFGQYPHRDDDVREALSLRRNLPVTHCDARSRDAAKAALIRLVEHAIKLKEEP